MLLLFCVLLLFQVTYGGKVSRAHVQLLSRLKKDHPDQEVKGIIDIGANDGTWSIEAKKIFGSAKVLMLEATLNKQDVLTKAVEAMGGPSVAAFQIAVMTGKVGEMVQFHGGGDTGNSIFKENTRFYAKSKPENRTTSTVDAEVSKSFLKDEPIDLLKIDVQGAELLVLEGASKTLERVTFVHLEQSIVNYNPGGACYFDVDSFLRSKGFYPHDFGEALRAMHLFKTKGIGQYDILYVNPNSSRAPPYMKRNSNTLYCGQDRPKESSPEPTSDSDERMAVGEKQEDNESSAFHEMENMIIDPVERSLPVSIHLRSKSRRRMVAAGITGFGFGFIFCFFLMQASYQARRLLKKS
mmetsp:Transcript_22717/g.39913  ORF Transcript_22717/g.39913 Transcript_22717/m.39913 type:complete len:353 (+) Transcript_22717:194-1252(+)